jgi:Legionella pneumophila major outer membrane protein precursor
MKTSLFVFAGILAAIFGLTQTSRAQYGPGPASPYGGYPAAFPQGPPPGMYGGGDMGMMPGMGMQVGYGPEVQAMAPSPGQAPLATRLEPDCEPGYGCHKWYGFAEFLSLRARDSEVAWGVPIDGATDADPLVRPPVQVGRVGVADLDFQPGYRIGFGRILNEATAIAFTYTEFQGNTHDLLGATAPNVLRPLVTHPSTFNAASDFLTGAADYGIRFKTIDVDYHSLFAYCCDYQVGYTLGIRYGQLQQNFRADFAANGTEFVDTSVNFYGTGLKAGLDGEKYHECRNLFVYGKTFLSLLGGESRATYLQGSSFDPVITDTSWKAGRLVTMYDLELGAGWKNDCGNVRLSIGYTYNIWYNVTRTNEWINAVQQNNFADQSDNFNAFMSFDGLVSRLEVRW